MAAKDNILGGGAGGGIEIGDQIAYAYYTAETWIPWVSADGVASRTLTRALAKNALIRKYTVRVGASRADGTTLDNSGQVRLQTDGPPKVIVVDFGMLRTVSDVGLVSPLTDVGSIQISSLRAFRGDKFDTPNLITGSTFEVRTERVRLEVTSSKTLQDIAKKVYLQFPDLPSDLDIRVNGGAPAWTAPGVAQPNTRGWDANTQQVVDLTDAFTPLTGNPKDAAALEANIVLASRIPGLLTLTEEVVDIAYLARVAFDGAEETTLVLDEEGEHDVALQLPAWVKTVQEVRLTFTGTVPAERVVPPVGPSIAMLSGGTGAAYDLVLDVDHAGAARLDVGAGDNVAAEFGELVAVRLPLRAGVEGAEVRVVMYEGTADGPTQLAAGGTTKPVDLAPAAVGTTNAGDVWTTFSLPKPIKLDAKKTYWAVVVVGRGGASWSLGRFTSALNAVPIRRGAATGPWHTLPNVLSDGATIGARVRAVGKARPSAPIAPLSLTVVGHETATVDVTPAPKGVAVTWTPGAASGTTHPAITPSGPVSAPTITLRVTNRMIGTIKLGAVDVVATK